ncbi:DUF3180 domain-containing protein [Corynebacterium mendelii]|uniref:DUF3180 domain-containing protein n=1 Tax=Corynebacterium mendelii TaxID=2765362 RepID=UPI002ED10A24
MTKTATANLVFAGCFCAAAAFILVRRFYGSLPPAAVGASVTLWALGLVCFVMGRKIRGMIDDRKVGMDRSQISPTQVAQWLVVGRASAWTGAIVGGAYLGVTAWLAMKLPVLDAAADDFPGALASLAGGLVLSVAGVYLERSCQAPPPPAAQAAEQA